MSKEYRIVDDPGPPPAKQTRLRGSGLMGVIERLQPGQALVIAQTQSAIISARVFSLRRAGRVNGKRYTTRQRGEDCWLYCLKEAAP